MDSFIKLAFQKKTVKLGLRVSLLVGVILNLINQGDAIFSLNFQNVSFSKMVLTFLVPYVVSVFSTVMTKKDIHQNNK